MSLENVSALSLEHIDTFYIIHVLIYIILCTELNQITGIAAILRFPMPELEDEDVSSSDEEEPEKEGLDNDEDRNEDTD